MNTLLLPFPPMKPTFFFPRYNLFINFTPTSIPNYTLSSLQMTSHLPLSYTSLYGNIAHFSQPPSNPSLHLVLTN